MRLTLVVLLVLAAALPAAAHADSPGSLDPSFGDAGLARITQPAGEPSAVPADVLVQPDGKVVIAGVAPRDVWVARFLPDGRPDVTFGVEGVSRTQFADRHGTHEVADVRAIALDARGGILIAGEAYLSTGRPGVADFQGALARLKPDGSPDRSFGDRGTQMLLSEGNSALVDLTVAPGGAVVAGAHVQSPPDRAPTWRDRYTAVRFDGSGRLDETWGAGGQVHVPVADADGFASPTGLVLAPDGRLYLGGFATARGEEVLAVVRLRADGTPDPTWDTDGIRYGPDAVFNPESPSMVLQPDGKLVLASNLVHRNAYGSYALAQQVTRYTTSGQSDPSFGFGGTVNTSIGTGDARSAGVAIDARGRILVAGMAYNGRWTWIHLTVSRYTPTGVLDRSFADDGVLISGTDRQDGEHRRPLGMTLDDRGRVVLGGTLLAGGFAARVTTMDPTVDAPDATDGAAAPDPLQSPPPGDVDVGATVGDPAVDAATAAAQAGRERPSAPTVRRRPNGLTLRRLIERGVVIRVGRRRAHVGLRLLHGRRTLGRVARSVKAASRPRRERVRGARPWMRHRATSGLRVEVTVTVAGRRVSRKTFDIARSSV